MQPINNASQKAVLHASACLFGGDPADTLKNFVEANSTVIPMGNWEWPAPLASLKDQLDRADGVGLMPSSAWQGVVLAYARDLGNPTVMDDPYFVDLATWTSARDGLLSIVEEIFTASTHAAHESEIPIEFGNDIAGAINSFAETSGNVQRAVRNWIEGRRGLGQQKTDKELTKALADEIQYVRIASDPSMTDTMGVVLVFLRGVYPEDKGLNGSFPVFLPSVWQDACDNLLGHPALFYR